MNSVSEPLCPLWRKIEPYHYRTTLLLDLAKLAGQWVRAMEPSDDEHSFLRDLIKASRQKSSHVEWTDRDGSKRLTALTPAEAARLNTLAHRAGISKSEFLRQAAHIPVAK